MATTVRVTPTGQERSFDSRELIVSKTDPKGIITYANQTFLDISHYGREAIIGQPHNIIRHHQMPRGLFSLLWDTIATGEEVFAYINNLAADGANYWVLAHVTATFDPKGRIVGYHSNRRRPARAPIEAVTPLYERMLAAEARHNRAVDAARAGRDTLLTHLQERETTYDRFIWNLINDHSLAGHR